MQDVGGTRFQRATRSEMPEKIEYSTSQGLTINMDAYIKDLEEVALPLVKRATTGRPHS